MIAIIKKLFFKTPEEKSTVAAIQPPAWSETYPHYYQMLRHEFISDGIRFQRDVIAAVNATFEFINKMAINDQQKEKTKELCLANAAFSARSANGVYFSREKKEEWRWGHEKWRQREHDWQYAVFYTALLIGLYNKLHDEKNIDLHNFSIHITDDELVFAIKNTIFDEDNDTMPHQFYPLIKRMLVKTSNFLNCHFQKTSAPVDWA